MKKNRLLWLGIFIAGGLGLVIWGIFFFSRKERIFESTFRLKSPFENVAGLRAGSAVRLSGIDIGVVENIKLPDSPGGNVLVTMRLDIEAQRLIKKDAQALIETEGLVGSKVVSLIGGSLKAPSVEDGDIIISRSPIDLTAILDSFDETARYMHLVTQSLDDITGQISRGQGTIGKMVYDDKLYDEFVSVVARSDSLFASMYSQMNRMGKIIGVISSTTDSILARVQSGEGTLGKLLYTDELHDEALASLSDVRDSLNLLMSDVRHGQGLVGRLVSDDTLAAKLDSTLTALWRVQHEFDEVTRITRRGALSFAENMEALKHNWLFKGYFERRGFFSQTEFEKDYQKRRQELAELEKNLQTQKRTLEEQAQQMRLLQRALQERMKELDKKQPKSNPE
jgi:phospholipid/cholesterol/gamma-HCH transport system substrate-binding protein